MGHEGSVIPRSVLEEMTEFESAAVPFWVVKALAWKGSFKTLGLYVQLAAKAIRDDEEKMRFTLSEPWTAALFEGNLSDCMRELIDVGAVTKVAMYPGGTARIQVQTYPPDVRKRMDAYRRPDGRLVVALG